MNKLTKFKAIFRQIKQLAQHLHLKKWEIMVLVVVVLEFAFPHQTLAANAMSEDETVGLLPTVMIGEQLANNDPSYIAPEVAEIPTASLPVAEAKKPKRVVWVTVTAYSSTVDQTDSDPCTTANGYNVCEKNIENVVAANFLTFGTEIKMPDYFGDRVFVVQDRMNKRFAERVDVWLKTRQAAREFGVRKLKIEIY